jgi:uncharacterized protein (TIGR02246 family)
MRNWLACIVVALACAPALAAEADAPAEEQAIKQHFKDFEAAWAKHDAKAVSAFYTDDADIVTESGHALVGRDAIEQALTNGFADHLQNSTLTETVQKVRLIKPDVALVDADASLKQGEGEPNKLHILSVLVKRDGKWLTETTRAIAYRQE